MRECNETSANLFERRLWWVQCMMTAAHLWMLALLRDLGKQMVKDPGDETLQLQQHEIGSGVSRALDASYLTRYDAPHWGSNLYGWGDLLPYGNTKLV